MSVNQPPDSFLLSLPTATSERENTRVRNVVCAAVIAFY